MTDVVLNYVKDLQNQELAGYSLAIISELCRLPGSYPPQQPPALSSCGLQGVPSPEPRVVGKHLYVNFSHAHTPLYSQGGTWQKHSGFSSGARDGREVESIFLGPVTMLSLMACDKFLHLFLFPPVSIGGVTDPSSWGWG